MTVRAPPGIELVERNAEPINTVVADPLGGEAFGESGVCVVLRRVSAGPANECGENG